MIHAMLLAASAFFTPSVRDAVDAAIKPLMTEYHIPGMAVGVVVDKRSYVFNYGVASIEASKPVTNDTLFEIGSVSKTLTATLSSYAQVSGHLSLSDATSKYLPELRGTAFGSLTLLNLGTHTTGGLPLQVPDGIQTIDRLIAYFKQWRPEFAPGTYRTYSNVSSGTLGFIAAKSMGQNFDALMEQRLFPALGMKNSYIDVPQTKMRDYAEGYRDGAPVRMTPGVLSSEAYGVRTTAADMVRFLEANMDILPVDGVLQRAIDNTHTGYFRMGAMTQDLIWEQYRYPVALSTLLAGNATKVIYSPARVTAIAPPEKPGDDVLIDKTGSTNGFGAYVAFVPQRRLGIVLLANENYPITERVTAAYGILSSLAGMRIHK